jgi:hypothetical protein
VVTLLEETAGDVSAHPSQTDDADLHGCSLSPARGRAPAL